MARGKTKLKKGQRSAGKSLSNNGNHHDSKMDSEVFDSLSHDHLDTACNHRNLNPQQMKKVASLLSKLFTTSFRLAVPSLFRGMVQNLQDHVLKEKVLGFLDAGFNPGLIKGMAKDESTREGIKVQIRMACEEELADVVLRLSTEDCFDLACDLAVRHGRNLKTYGPPCACSFSHCLGCLEKLVTNVCDTPPLPAPPIRPVDRQELVHAIEDIMEGEDGIASEIWGLGNVKELAQLKDPKWVEQIGDAWQNMADTLWETADDIDSLQLPRVKEALDALCKLDGLDLWYTVVMRELEASSGVLPQSKGKKSTRALASTMSGEYEKMKKENGKLKRVENGQMVSGEDVDVLGVGVRKALARAIREQGNIAYSKQAYQEASEHYTRAMGYDEEEAVYPLNRAACMVKLARFLEADHDCSIAIRLDSKNHKAWFRKGVSQAGMGNLDAAAENFRQVLLLQKDDLKGFIELRKLSLQFLVEAAKKAGNVLLSSKADSLLPTQEEIFEKSKKEDSSEDRESNSNDSDSIVSDQQPTVSEVFSQVSFAIAFSQILKQQTGIDVKVPVSCWSSPPTTKQ